jgi:hypothetical protein
MTPNLHTGSEPSLASLATSIIHDVQDLFKKQLDLFKHEVETNLRKTREATASLALGMLCLFLGSVLLCLTVVFLLHWLFAPKLDLWVCFLIVTGLVGIPGAILAYYARQKFREVSALPEQSTKALKENLEWTTKPR